MAKRRRLDKSVVTDPSSAFDLFSHSIRKALDFDFYDAGVTRFTAIVLTQPILLNPASMPTSWPDLSGILGGDTAGLGKFTFFARIIGDNSPHSFLPDPCDPAIADDVKAQLQRVKLHTRFFSTKDSSILHPKVGDTVVVELKQNAFSYNLYCGEYVKLLDSTAANATTLQAQDCSGIANNFENLIGGPGDTGSFLGDPGGGLALEPGEAQTSEKEPEIITVAKTMGFVTYDDGRINTIGVRNAQNRMAGKFDDLIHLTWKIGGMWTDVQFTITTDPSSDKMKGVAYNSDKGRYHGSDTAEMKEGQFMKSHKFGPGALHSGYRAMNQKKGAAYRDRNKDAVLDWEATELVKPNDTLNIHRASPSRKSTSVNSNWSHGCQVFADVQDWKKAFQIWTDAHARLGTRNMYIDYILIRSSDVPSLGGGVATVPSDGTAATDPTETLSYKAEQAVVDAKNSARDLVGQEAYDKASEVKAGVLGALGL